MPGKQTLREEILGMLDIFDYYCISEDSQEWILTHGIRFSETPHNVPDPFNEMDARDFAAFLKKCRVMNLDIDAEDIIKNPTDPKYKQLIDFVTSADIFLGDCPRLTRP